MEKDNDLLFYVSKYSGDNMQNGLTRETSFHDTHHCMLEFIGIAEKGDILRICFETQDGTWEYC